VDKWKDSKPGYYEALLAAGKITKKENIEPDIGPFVYYFECFRELATSRNNGMEAGPIPWDKIVEYYRVFIDPKTTFRGDQDFEDFYYYIRIIDDTTLRLHNKKAAVEIQKKEAKKAEDNKAPVAPPKKRG
jgi:hypothetical protein